MYKKDEYTILGLMSGTSLDGLDMALCHFKNDNGKWNYEVIAADTIAYDNDMRIRLSRTLEMSAHEFLKLDVDLAHVMSSYINRFISQQDIKPEFIASHGHTTFHQPALGITSQIGNGAVIAAETGITTVCDFRTLDVALGGQGAPLVPIGDELLFGLYDACLNLGGFSNISFRQDGRRIAFDVSPCNMALNYLANKLNMDYDKDGMAALSGKIDHQLLDDLNNIEFYKKKGAKSLGKEWFDKVFNPIIESYKSSIEDKLRTVTEHIAAQISAASQGSGTMLITGGGAKNKFLIERIQSLNNKQIIIPDEQTIDFKEAIIFAFLGVLRLRGETNCLKDVTGARKNCCGGVIYQA